LRGEVERRWRSAGIGDCEKERRNFGSDVDISLHWRFSDWRMFLLGIAVEETVETGEQLLQDQEN